ncbi:MAG: hypothetical protein KIS78_03280 [Labilithrix sp.]|nr:hypothetical protein [Labilithrix sp.]MCW5831465.1 hypothetical protein [Labilithrix sp.]
MATRAEQEKARAQRSSWRKKKRKPHVHREKSLVNEAGRQRRAADAAQYTSGRYAGGVTAQRNIKEDQGDHVTHDLEDSATGRPSRKSTRKGAHSTKPDTQLRRRATRKTSSPEERASRAKAKKARRRGSSKPASARSTAR